MGTILKIAVATLLMGAVLIASPRLFLIIVLMTVGVAVATVVEIGRERFKGNIVLHKCCANVHWVFITFYVFAFDKLHPIKRVGPFELAMTAVTVSFALYIFATINAHQVLASAEPAIFTSKNEQRSILCAAWSLALALGFAWLIR